MMAWFINMLNGFAFPPNLHFQFFVPTISKSADVNSVQCNGIIFQVDKLVVPWKSILSSPPVWGIVAANFALDWAFYILLISMPIFLLDVMKTSITKVTHL